MKNLEEKIESKKDLEYIKEQISELTILYMEELTNAIRKASENTQEWNKMKMACVEEAKRYQPDIVVKPLIKALQHGN